MTALKKFERLESLGLWKETETSQKKEVIVSFGKTSLVLTDNKGIPLTHWTLSAVKVSKARKDKVIYTPDKNGFETLEISDQTMNRAIKKIQKIIHKPQTHSGRIRLLSSALIVLCISLLTMFWLPSALADYATGVISKAKAREISTKLLPHINQYAGLSCYSSTADPVLRKLEARLINTTDNSILIADLGARYSTHLPGGIIMINRVLVENFSGPEALSGFVLMERDLQIETPAIRSLFLKAGPVATLSFLITGKINDNLLGTYVKDIMTKPLALPNLQVLLNSFNTTGIPSTPLAKLINNQKLMEGDPVKGQYNAILTDPEWLALQSICEN